MPPILCQSCNPMVSYRRERPGSLISDLAQLFQLLILLALHRFEWVSKQRQAPAFVGRHAIDAGIDVPHEVGAEVRDVEAQLEGHNVHGPQ